MTSETTRPATMGAALPVATIARAMMTTRTFSSATTTDDDDLTGGIGYRVYL